MHERTLYVVRLEGEIAFGPLKITRSDPYHARDLIRGGCQVSSPTKRLILADYRFADIARGLITLAKGFGFPWLD